MSSQGRIAWYDLMTTDPGAAETFYTKLAGWTTQAWEGPMPYTMWANGGVPLGGVNDLPEEAREAGAPPHWLSYTLVDDVEATAARATELGATVYVAPQEIPGSGHFAVLADPGGATFAVYSNSGEDMSSDAQPQVGDFCWHDLLTEDREAAFEFYAELFGWVKAEAFEMGELGIYQIFSRRADTPPLGGMFNKPVPDMPSYWMPYLRVADVRASAELARNLGGQVVDEPREVPGGDLIATCMDPQGAVFALHSTAE